MAMSGAVLGAAIAAKVSDTPEAIAISTVMWEKIASVIVEHIQSNAQVLPGIVVTTDPVSGTGSTTGPGMIM